MLYAILCYDSEDVVGSWTKEEDDAAVAALDSVQHELRQAGRLGPVARLLPTTTAMTIRHGKHPVVLDGPFTETKEALLGFFIVECESLEQALETGKDLARHNPAGGCYEIRPLRVFRPGTTGA
jgi:hypothetical protein